MSVSYTSFFLSLWMDILVNIVLFEVGHFPVHLGTLGAGVRYDCWHLWVGEACQCIGPCVWLKYIPVGWLNIPLHLLHFPGKLVQGSWPKVKYITFYAGVPTHAVSLGFKLRTLVLGRSLLTLVHLCLGFFSLVLVSQVLWLVHFRGTGWFSFTTPFQYFLLLC